MLVTSICWDGSQRPYLPCKCRSPVSRCSLRRFVDGASAHYSHGSSRKDERLEVPCSLRCRRSYYTGFFSVGEAVKAFLFAAARWSGGPGRNGLPRGRGHVLLAPCPLRLDYCTLPCFRSPWSLSWTLRSVTRTSIRRTAISSTLNCYRYSGVDRQATWTRTRLDILSIHVKIGECVTVSPVHGRDSWLRMRKQRRPSTFYL